MFFSDIKKTKWVLVVSWMGFLGLVALWLERESEIKDREKAFVMARAFFEQVVITRQWNASHGGVYVPVSDETPPNKYLPPDSRVITSENGLELARINPAYMTRQIAELAQTIDNGIQFHITSLKPIRPENRAEEWEKEWLRSFEQGGEEQGEFIEEGGSSLFRYMAPLTVNKGCIECHGKQGYKVGDIRGGISVTVPYEAHEHVYLIMGLGSATLFGLIMIFVGTNLLERKQGLFEATFNSPVPSCVMGLDYTILIGNESYWKMFGSLPDRKKTIKCHDHRPTDICHTDSCPLIKVKSNTQSYSFHAIVEIDGVPRHFLDTVQPVYDKRKKLIGCVESLQEITDLKIAESALADSNRKLEALSTTDGLTNIANRRHFDEVLAQEFARHSRSEEQLSLIMLDIDYFKKFNDRYGHLEGDKCLQKVAQVLVECVNRPADLPARFGGEEFACILPSTDRSGATAVAEKVRKGIFDCGITHEDSDVAPCVTASLGVVSVQCSAYNAAEEVIQLADELLYKAKSSGRNRVEALGSEKLEIEGVGEFVRLIWKDSYLSGDPVIDSQHQTLFHLSNQLFEALFKNLSDEVVMTLYSQLMSEVREHFRDEEKILEKIGYPGLKQHTELHTNLLEKSLDLFQVFSDSKLNTGDLIHFFVGDIVRDHMIKEDRKFYKYIP